MKTLVLSDIHANEPALTAVLRDAGSCDRIVFLGDLANFGPHPAECVKLLKGYNPICIIGNHDAQIVSDNPKNFWDKWSKKMLSEEQQKWIGSFCESYVLDNHILLLHGSYNVEYDILPTTSDNKIKEAFKDYLTDGIDEVWFGHYHYQIDRVVEDVTYRCIRPVGHHRDKDTRAGYTIYEDGKIIHKRVEYDLQKSIDDFMSMEIFTDMERKVEFASFMKNAFSEKLLAKDLKQMEEDLKKAE